MASSHPRRVWDFVPHWLKPNRSGSLSSAARAWSLDTKTGRGSGYLIALLFVVLATIVRMVLDPVLGEEFPFVPYLCAIVFSFYFGGLGPSLMTMALGFVATGYFFLTPRGSVLINNLQSQIGGAFYLAVGGSTILLMEGMKAAQRRANHNEEELLQKQSALETEIRERREAQEAYVRLLRRMVSIQEVERRRISRELHDQCGQDLTALDIGLKIVEELIGPQNRTALQHLKSMHETLGRVAREVHDLALELRPPSLDDLGLNEAIKGFVESWGERTAIAVDFESRGLNDIPLAPEVETAIYRTVIEALTNVAKHAAVSRASVVLEIQGSNLILIVEDQGRGFDIDSTSWIGSPPQHLGLLGMRERIEAAGGTLEIESTRGGGTTIFAKAPITGMGEKK